MSTIAMEREAAEASPRPTPRGIPMTRIVGVELQKMFDTRSGFWLLASIGIAATLATAAVIVFAPESEQVYSSFAGAIGFPMAVILPMIAILSVTSEWTQRSGLSTFTLVPHRGRVIAAKAIGAVGIGVVSMLLAMAIGALGNVVGTAITGNELVWDASVGELSMIIVANVLGLLVGFMLGVLIRNSPGAIVSYFIYSLLFPTVFGMLAAYQDWFRDLQGWVDFNYAQSALFNGVPDGEQWAQIGTSGLIWLVAPLAVGLWMLMRSEVK